MRVACGVWPLKYQALCNPPPATDFTGGVYEMKLDKPLPTGNRGKQPPFSKTYFLEE